MNVSPVSVAQRVLAFSLSLMAGVAVVLPQGQALAASGSLEGVVYDAGRHQLLIERTGRSRASLNVATTPAGQRLIVDLEDAEVGLSMPRDSELLQQLQARWPDVYRVSVSQFGGTRPVVRLVIDLSGEPVKATLAENAGRLGIQLTALRYMPSPGYEPKTVEPYVEQASQPPLLDRARFSPSPPEVTPYQPGPRVDSVAYQRAINQVESQQREIQQLRWQLDQAADKLVQVEQLQRQINQMNAQLQAGGGSSSVGPDGEARIQELETALVELDRRYTALQGQQQQATASQAQYERLEQQYRELERQLAVRSQSGGATADEIAAMKAQLAEAKDALATSVGTINEQNQKIAALNDQIDSMSQGVESSARAQITLLNTKLEAAEQELARLKVTSSNSQISEAAVSALEERLASAESRNMDLSRQIELLQQSGGDVAALRAEYEQKLANLKQLLNESTEAVKTAETEKNQLEARMAQLENQRVSTNIDLVRQEYEKQLASAKAEMAALSQSAHESELNNSQLQRRVTDLERQLADAAAATQRIVSLESQVEGLNNDLQRARAGKQVAEDLARRLKDREPSTVNAGNAASPQFAQAESLFNRGNSLLDDNKIVEATVLYRDAYKAIPSEKRYAIAYAEGLLRTSNFAEATRIMETYLATNPYDVDAYNLLGKAHLLNGKFEPARQAFSQAIPVPVLNNYATTLKKLGRVEESEQIFVTALSLNPNDSDLLFNLGNLYNSTNQLDKAKSSYEQALVARPDFAPAHYNLGLIYSKLGDKPKAITHLEKFLTLTPGADNADVVRQYVTKLKG